MAEVLEWEAFRGRVSEFLGVEPETLDQGTHIYDQLGIDSLGMFSLGMHLIKCFGITLPLATHTAEQHKRPHKRVAGRREPPGPAGKSEK